MKPLLLRLFVFILWASTAWWLIRYEAFPEYFTGTAIGYISVVPSDTLVRDNWLKIRLNGIDIGYAHSGLSADKTNGVTRYILTYNYAIDSGLQIKYSDINIEHTIYMDNSFRMNSFTSSFEAANIRLNTFGFRTESNHFTITKSDGGKINQFDMMISDDTIILDPIAIMGMPRANQSSGVKIKTIDPFSMQTSTMRIKRVDKHGKIPHGETSRNSELSVLFMGIDIRLLLDDENTITRIYTPLGISLVKCSPEAAFATISKRNKENLMPEVTSQKINQYINFISKSFSSQNAAKESNDRNQ